MKMVIAKLLFVAAVTTLAWFNVSAAILAVCASIIVTLYDKVESLIELSFGPLRAKLERNLSASEKIVEKLRTYAAVQAKAAIAASVHTGRFASGTDWIFVNAKKIEAGLRELGLSDADLEDARKEFVDLTLSDLGSMAIGGGQLPMHLPDEARKEWHELNRAADRNNPDAIEAYLNKWGELTPERRQLVEDMRWVREHRDVEDRDQYLRAQEPIEWRGQA